MKYYIRSGALKFVADGASPRDAVIKALDKHFDKVDIGLLRRHAENAEEFIEAANLAIWEQYAQLGLWTFASERGFSYGPDSIRCDTQTMIDVVMAKRREAGK